MEFKVNERTANYSENILSLLLTLTPLSLSLSLSLTHTHTHTHTHTQSKTATSLCSFETNSDYVYDVQWSPIHPALFVSVNGEGRVDFWNINHDSEVTH